MNYLTKLSLLSLLFGCSPVSTSPPINYPPPILNPLPPQKCRIQLHSKGFYDTKFQVECDVGKLNGKTACLPSGMWEEVGAAWATPECDRLFDWSKRNNNPCLDGRNNFVLSSNPHAGIPQTCGDFKGVIYQISPTDRTLQYDKANGCQVFGGFVLDLTGSRASQISWVWAYAAVVIWGVLFVLYERRNGWVGKPLTRN